MLPFLNSITITAAAAGNENMIPYVSHISVRGFNILEAGWVPPTLIAPAMLASSEPPSGFG